MMSRLSFRFIKSFQQFYLQANIVGLFWFFSSRDAIVPSRIAVILKSGRKIKAMIVIRISLDYILSNAPQWPKADHWPVLAHNIISKIISTRPQKTISRLTYILLGVRFWLTEEFRLIFSCTLFVDRRYHIAYFLQLRIVW